MTVDDRDPSAERTPSLLLQEVRALNDAADRLSAELEQRLTEALRRVVQPGVRLDLRERRGLPECLWSVNTSHGNDRGSRVFEVVSEPRVQVKLNALGLSTWACEARPVSETTGKTMSGRTANGSSRDTVTLRGHLVDPNLSALLDEAPSEDERFAAFLDGRPVMGRSTPRRRSQP